MRGGGVVTACPSHFAATCSAGQGQECFDYAIECCNTRGECVLCTDAVTWPGNFMIYLTTHECLAPPRKDNLSTVRCSFATGGCLAVLRNHHRHDS